MWNIGDRIIKPNGGEGWVINNSNPSAILVQHKVEGSLFTESFPADKLKPAPKRDNKELNKVAENGIRNGIEKNTKAFSDISNQKTVRIDESGKRTMQDAEKKDEK